MKNKMTNETIYKANTLKILLMMVIASFSFTEAWAANCGSPGAVYYVDYAGGKDANNGTSTATPWQHAPGDTVYKNCTLQAGDRVIFKGGVSYKGSISIQTSPAKTAAIVITASGSGDADNQRIIYDGDSGDYVARWAAGTDKAIIEGNRATNTAFHFNAARSYITINHFVIKDFSYAYPTFSAPRTYAGFLVNNNYYNSHYVTVSNNDMSHAGIWDNIRASGACVFNGYGNYWKVHDNTLTDCGSTGIGLVRTNYAEVYNNTISGRNSWPVSLQGDTTTANVSITGNKIHDNTWVDINKGYPNCCAEVHCNYMFITTGGGTSLTGAINDTHIYNNLYYNTYTVTAQNRANSIGMMQISNATGSAWNGLYVYNNVLFNQDYRGIDIHIYDNTPGSMTNVYVLNNTIYTPQGQPMNVTNSGNAADPSLQLSNVYIKNNNLVSLDAGAIALDISAADRMSGTVDIDYNNYYSTRANFQFRVEGVYKDWNGWKALGYDAHGNGPTSNPLFFNTTIGSDFNLRLKPGSPAINKGYGMWAQFDKDIDGRERLHGIVWDIGAYEHGLPPAPTNLRIIQ